MRRALALLAVVLLAVQLLATGCGPHASTPGASDVQVDTPKLRAMKAEAGIKTCVPGTGSSTTLPSLTLPCLGGGPAVDLAGLEGPLIINLWASNCIPCRKEIPALQQFYERYGDKVGVLGIDWVDTYPAAALDLLRQSRATYPELADPGGDLLDQKTLALQPASPQFVFVRADGTVERTAGGLKDVDQVKQLAEQHLGVTL